MAFLAAGVSLSFGHAGRVPLGTAAVGTGIHTPSMLGIGAAPLALAMEVAREVAAAVAHEASPRIKVAVRTAAAAAYPNKPLETYRIGSIMVVLCFGVGIRRINGQRSFHCQALDAR